jgi:hypothetical protein
MPGPVITAFVPAQDEGEEVQLREPTKLTIPPGKSGGLPASMKPKPPGDVASRGGCQDRQQPPSSLSGSTSSPKPANDAGAIHAGEPPKLDLMRLHPRCPTRPPDWRWHWARLLVDEVLRPSRRRDDESVLRAMRFLSVLNFCKDETDHETLAERMPDLWQAHAIYTGPPTLRWAVEARILAGESFESIASKCGISAAAVACYEQTFFSVLEEMGHTDWILFAAIGAQLYTGLSEQDVGVLWKLLGYHGGPLVVDFLVNPFHGQARPGRHDEVATFATDHVQAMLLRKLAVGALTLPVNAATAPKLLKLYARILESERRAAERLPKVASILPNIHVMWEGLPGSLKDGLEQPPGCRETAEQRSQLAGVRHDDEGRSNEPWPMVGQPPSPIPSRGEA